MPLSRTMLLGLSRNQRADTATWPETLAAGLMASLGSPVERRSVDDYEQLLDAVVSSKVDVAWLPPLLQSRALKQGAQLVALPQRGGWLTFRSAILVKQDNPVNAAAALRRVRAAWSDRSSASGYLFPRLELVALAGSAGDLFASEKFYGSVADAAAAVERGEADLSTCFVTDPAARDEKRARDEIDRTLGAAAASLRVLHVSDPIPPDGFVVAPRLAPGEADAIKAALLALHEKPEGRAALKEVLHAERLAPVNQKLMDSLRNWAEAATARGQ